MQVEFYPTAFETPSVSFLRKEINIPTHRY